MNEHAIFGLNPMWLSGIILVIVYIILILEKLNRAVIALFGAMLMIYCGLLNQEQALRAVDFNTLWLLTGMMMMVNITAKTGVFQYVAIRSAKWVRADPIGIMLMLTGITALFSALLDNVTTVLLVTPITLLITEQLRVRAFPYLFATIVASNVGGTATLIGDPAQHYHRLEKRPQLRRVHLPPDADRRAHPHRRVRDAVADAAPWPENHAARPRQHHAL